ncbi:MAG TPA: MBL fold metallo-hydrolase [Actinomycetota bacterium]|nr:MBL fold metallo-hydrolase [Actinomycetota bacterium]
MAASHLLNVDLAKIYMREGDRDQYLTTVAWGDPLDVREIADDHVRVGATTTFTDERGSPRWKRVDGFIRPPRSSKLKGADLVVERDASRVLKVDFVDVQQGDAAVIESPSGKVVLVDGGENQLFARYLANRFRNTEDDKPKEIDAIVVTHGDADHFSGLTEIHESESHGTPWKRLYIHPQRIFHNGLVKRPSRIDGKRVPDDELLGPTVERDGATFVTDLHDDLLQVPDEEMNEPFKRWKEALQTFAGRGPIEMRRLAAGDDDAFAFLGDDGVDVAVLGPFLEDVGGGKLGLRFLGTPRNDEELRNQPIRPTDFVGKSASHTINGHSVILQMTYGKARFLFAGDLNAQSEEELVGRHRAGDVDLTSEVLKVPHHGSGDFSPAFLEAAAPVLSVVSSGDENSLKEYIHPRATLVGALGRWSRPGVAEPIVFVTEMVAFFEALGFIRPEFHKLRDGEAVLEGGGPVKDDKALAEFFAFRRAAFGIVKIRTDGERLLVWTNSGQVALKEAYAFDLTADPPRRVNLKRA